MPGLPAPLRLTVAGGKIVVPFGADPLYHQNYGGLGGFDQPVLPIIWATEGATAHLLVERREFVLTDDLFVVRGFALPHADSIINLQSGFSPEDDVELGWGNRLGAAWRFVSAWYSAYYNPLGFGRRLFMQAFDLTIARPRGVPVLQHFSLGAGLLRADVSGGGAGVGGVGLDYYNFADYLQLRYYPTDWLYVQYRTGSADLQQPPGRRARQVAAHERRRFDPQLRRRGPLPRAHRRPVLLHQPREGRRDPERPPSPDRDL